MERQPRKQARALLVKEVIFLEDYLECESNLLLGRYAAGSFLFALHSRARLGDLKEICEVILDFMPSGEGFIRMLSRLEIAFSFVPQLRLRRNRS